MKQKILDRHLMIGANGRNEVWVYDGCDVEYSRSSGVNYKYYFDAEGKRYKTRPYTQWTAMVGRGTKNGSHQKRYECYLGVKISPEFLDFDSWVDWAQNQVGFMCLDEKGRLYQLDKDLLGNGKLYSEDTCCFLPCSVNTSLVGLSNCRVTEYIDRGFGFELEGCNKVFDYRFLDTVSKINSEYKIKNILSEYFDILCEDVIEKLVEKSKSVKYGVKEKHTMTGKVLCLDYFTNFLVVYKKNMSLDECYGVHVGYKGKLKYSYSACGYDWCKIAFGEKCPSFSNNMNLEIYTIILRILATRWYLLNEVLCENSRNLLEESLGIMEVFFGKYTKYGIEWVCDYGVVSEFIESTVNNIYDTCGGIKVTW